MVGHPYDNGQPISARDPAVLNKSGIGFVFRSQANGKLTAEGWFDVEATQRVNNQIFTALEAGQPIELSTGLYTDNEPAGQGATFNGIPYTYIARNYRPDHLAILPDQKGACSIADGCGVLVNKSEETSPQPITPVPMEKLPMADKTLVNGLIANCDCWKEGDREVLNTLSDEKLKELLANAKKIKAGEVVVNTARKALEDGVEDKDGNKYTFNVDTGKWDVAKKAKENSVTPEPVANAQPVKPQTEAEWLASAPAGIQSAVRNAMQIEMAEKASIINGLVANAAEDAQPKLRERLAIKPLDELRDLQSLLPQPVANKGSAVSYFGLAGGTVNTPQEKKVVVEPLGLPTINWAEEPVKV